MRHLVSDDVGCVGGTPVPLEEKTWIDKCRLIEVYMRHGFFQVSLDGYDGVMGIHGNSAPAGFAASITSSARNRGMILDRRTMGGHVRAPPDLSADASATLGDAGYVGQASAAIRRGSPQQRTGGVRW
ncbi:hypothetical protein ABLE94_12140 [Gordonia sp. VNK1]|uniref:hypothetical protein n=1 Tax=Gordonia oleivorans TaxID=3156618 RepID=UPI0032B46770